VLKNVDKDGLQTSCDKQDTYNGTSQDELLR